MPVRVIHMTTHQILLNAHDTSRHYAKGRYLDAYNDACCAAYLAYHARNLSPSDGYIYAHAFRLRQHCRVKLDQLIAKGATP